MTDKVIIDVSNCSHKRDDECMEVPICNEYGDLMGYQSCEAQTLCPYRSQKKIERLEQENDNLKSYLEEIRKLTIIGVNASQYNCGLRALADDILDKINEVLGNENRE